MFPASQRIHILAVCSSPNDSNGTSHHLGTDRESTVNPHSNDCLHAHARICAYTRVSIRADKRTHA
eukprot:6200779-Pleurochrysis_carterae.AAC.2